MKVVQIPVGDMASNVLIVFNDGENKAFIVDAGGATITRLKRTLSIMASRRSRTYC